MLRSATGSYRPPLTEIRASVWFLWIRSAFIFAGLLWPNRNDKKTCLFVVLMRLKKKKKLQFPASTHEGTENAPVGDRELQATTDRNKGTRTTATTIQVDIGSLRPARTPYGEKSRVSRYRAKIAVTT